MDLTKILDTTPEPPILDPFIDTQLAENSNVSGDYWLPIPFSPLQRKLTEQVVSLHYSDILKFFESPTAPATAQQLIVESLETMFRNAQLVCTHPYLLVEHLMPKSLLLKDVPQKLAAASGKFAVLRDIISLVSSTNTTIAIVARDGKAVDLLEAFVYNHKVNCRRLGGSTLKENGKNKAYTCTVCPVPCGLDVSAIPTELKVDFVLAFDDSFVLESPVGQRLLRPEGGVVPPIVRFVPPNSIEHCILSFSEEGDSGKDSGPDSADKNPGSNVGTETENLTTQTGIITGNSEISASKPGNLPSCSSSPATDPTALLTAPHLAYLRNVAAAVVVLRDRAGILPSELRQVYAGELRYLEPWLRQPQTPWLLPNMPPVPHFTAQDVEKSLLTEVRLPPEEEPHELSVASAGARHESRHESRDSYYNRKRLKRDYITNPLNQNPELLTGISLITEESYQSILTHRLVRKIAEAVTEHKRQAEELQSYAEAEPLRAEDLQDARMWLAKMQQDIQALEARLTVAQHRREKSVREAAEVEKKTAELRARLEDSPARVPGVAGCVAAKLRAAELLAEKKRLLGKLEAAKAESAYMEAEVDKASVSVAESDTKLAELQTAISAREAEIKSGRERLRSLNFSSERGTLDGEVAQLKEKLGKLEAQLAEKFTRLNELDKNQRGRYIVRWGPNGTRLAVQIGPGRSRGASPATTGGHPLQHVTTGW